jgi:hypothetical protein
VFAGKIAIHRLVAPSSGASCPYYNKLVVVRSSCENIMELGCAHARGGRAELARAHPRWLGQLARVHALGGVGRARLCAPTAVGQLPRARLWKQGSSPVRALAAASSELAHACARGGRGSLPVCTLVAARGRALLLRLLHGRPTFPAFRCSSSQGIVEIRDDQVHVSGDFNGEN